MEKKIIHTATEFGAIANDGKDDTAAFQAMLKAGGDIHIEAGVYDFIGKKGIHVNLDHSINVNATGAVFVSHRVGGDLFSLDAKHNTPSGTTINWTGGTFDIRQHQNSTVTPWNNVWEARNTGKSATADALSIRGDTVATGKTVPQSKISAVNISDITIKASNTNWLDAGGDSGVFISGVGQAEVSHSTFIGIRDAAIYFSANDATNHVGGNYHAHHNTIINSAVGITSKRGADNLVFEHNTITDTAVSIAVAPLDGNNNTANNVQIRHNEIDGAWTAIRIEHATNVDISFNSIDNLGKEAIDGVEPIYQKYTGIWVDEHSEVFLDSNDIKHFSSNNKTAIHSFLATDNEGNNVLASDSGQNNLMGGHGLETLSYAYSDTRVIVSLHSNTALSGYAQGDTIADFQHLTGSQYDDILSGDNQHGNKLKGLGGDDWIRGNDGDDTIEGGAGSDKLEGGVGSDTFVFNQDALSSGIDRITDFKPQHDHLDLSALQLSADDITIRSTGNNTMLSIQQAGESIDLALLEDTNWSSISQFLEKVWL